MLAVRRTEIGNLSRPGGETGERSCRVIFQILQFRRALSPLQNISKIDDGTKLAWLPAYGGILTVSTMRFFNLDDLGGVHAQALQLQAKRLEVLAANISNADTPNYKARDIDFRAVLAKATELVKSPKLATTQPGHLSSPTADATPGLMYRVPLAPALDGNTVDVQLEQAAFAESTVRYQSSLMFVGVRNLMIAITGQ